MTAATRPRTSAVNARIRAGETVYTDEVVAAIAADTTRADLDALASSLTARTATPHHVYRVPASGLRAEQLAVYPESYATAFAAAGLDLERL